MESPNYWGPPIKQPLERPTNTVQMPTASLADDKDDNSIHVWTFKGTSLWEIVKSDAKKSEP